MNGSFFGAQVAVDSNQLQEDGRKVSFYEVSQAAIKALESYIVGSKLERHTRNSLSQETGHDLKGFSSWAKGTYKQSYSILCSQKQLLSQQFQGRSSALGQRSSLAWCGDSSKVFPAFRNIISSNYNYYNTLIDIIITRK